MLTGVRVVLTGVLGSAHRGSCSTHRVLGSAHRGTRHAFCAGVRRHDGGGGGPVRQGEPGEYPRECSGSTPRVPEGSALGVPREYPRGVLGEYPASTPRVPPEYPASTPRVPREYPAVPCRSGQENQAVTRDDCFGPYRAAHVLVSGYSRGTPSTIGYCEYSDHTSQVLDYQNQQERVLKQLAKA